MQKKKHLILAGFILLKFILQYFAVNPVYELQRDEYLHLDQARHLSWGYISVPPFTSWIAFIINALGGGTFWVRFFPALFGALTIVVVWKIIEALKGNLFAQCLGATAILFSVMVRLNILFQPNSSDVLCWTLFYYIIIKHVSTQQNKWLYWAGVVAGIGFLSKYNFAFLLIGLLPAVVLSPHRKLFTQKAFYVAVAIAFIIILPNLIWQYQKHFPTVHQLGELVQTQLDNVDRFDFLKQQILFFINSIWIIIAALIALAVYAPFRPYRFLLLQFIFALAVYTFLRAKGYYAIGLYPVLIAFGSVYISEKIKQRNALKTILITIDVLLSMPLLLIALPLESPQQIKQHKARYHSLGLLKWEDGKEHDIPQDFADMQGWKEMASKVDSAYAGITDKAHTLVICDNYGQAGAINYYSRFSNINAVSLNADYIYWLPLKENIVNVILVKWHADKDPARTKEQPLFDTVELKSKIENTDAIEHGTSIYVLLGAKISINDRIIKERDERLGW